MAIDTKEIGQSGLASWGGHITEEFLADLRFGPGSKGYARYNEMRLNCPVVAAFLAAIEQTANSVQWQVTGDSETDGRVEFVNECLDALEIPLKTHISEALSMLAFGWAYFETVYKRDGARLVWDYFAVRGQDTLQRWEIGDRGKINGMYQLDNTYREVLIPIDKAILYRTCYEKNNPEGRSLLRPSWTSYYFWKNLSTIEAIGVERDLAGMPMITLPNGATTDTGASSDKSVAEKVVRNVRNDEQAGIVLPSPDWAFELLSSGGSKQFNTSEIITRYEQRILMSVLSQFLMLGSNGVGSLALSKDQSDFFTMNVNALLDNIADTFTRYAIRKLLELNRIDPTGVQLTHTPAGGVDLASIGTFLQQAGGFLTWTPTDEAWLRAAADLPEIDINELEERQAAKEERANAMAQALQQRTQEKPDEDTDEEEPQEEMKAELFYSRKLTDQQRRLWEGRYQKAMAAYMAGQKRRVLAGLSGVRNGK